MLHLSQTLPPCLCIHPFPREPFLSTPPDAPVPNTRPSSHQPANTGATGTITGTNPGTTAAAVEEAEDAEVPDAADEPPPPMLFSSSFAARRG